MGSTEQPRQPSNRVVSWGRNNLQQK